MAEILLLYSTTDGHTRKICERLQQVIELQPHQVTLACVDDEPEITPHAFDTVVIGASIRYGRHRPQVLRYIERHAQALDARANAFFSVNIVARKPEKSRPETNPYLRKFLRRIAWRPRELEVFAGMLDYPRYGPFDRNVIRLIMWMTKGPTDPSTVIDYTDWQQVDAFGRRIAAMGPVPLR